MDYIWCNECGAHLLETGRRTCPYCEGEYCPACIEEHIMFFCVGKPDQDEGEKNDEQILYMEIT